MMRKKKTKNKVLKLNETFDDNIENKNFDDEDNNTYQDDVEVEANEGEEEESLSSPLQQTDDDLQSPENKNLNDIPTPNIRTRYGREIKSVQHYIPSMAGGQKYEETINTNIEVHE